MVSTKSFRGTTDELQEQIAWLEDDIHACQAVMAAATDAAEKSEYRMRMSADRQELLHLKSLLVSLKD